MNDPVEPDRPTEPKKDPRPEIQLVLEANQAFYTAHEERDLPAMIAIWDHSNAAVCIHPGWPAIRGWAAIEAAWGRIFSGPGRNQFILTNLAGSVRGTVAWVTLDENLMDSGNTTTIAATNVFVRRNDGWKMTLHHGSPVVNRQH